jgi:CheY-like chemotaxis protein
MMKELSPAFGFGGGSRQGAELSAKLESIAMAAVRKRFSPEFVNRIDAVVTYQPLDSESLSAILDQHIAQLQQHVNTRLGARCFTIEVPRESRAFLIEKGTSVEYGARELKRTVHRHLTQPLATLVASGQIDPGARVRVEVAPEQDRLVIRTVEAGPAPGPKHPTILIVDDNASLLDFLQDVMSKAQWQIVTAGSAEQALAAIKGLSVDAALLDFLLPGVNGVGLGVQLKQRNPRTQVVIMSGEALPPEAESISDELGFPIIRKPFVTNDVIALIRARLGAANAASG